MNKPDKTLANAIGAELALRARLITAIRNHPMPLNKLAKCIGINAASLSSFIKDTKAIGFAQILKIDKWVTEQECVEYEDKKSAK